MVSGRTCVVLSAILGVVLLCCNFYSGDAVSCYECNSYKDKDCDADTPPDVYKTDCFTKYNESYVECRKAVLYTDAGLREPNTESEKRIIRSCGWVNTSNAANSCYRRTGTGWLQFTCSCRDDYCNSGPRISFTTATVGVLLLHVLNMF